jgi:hypothetical protein
MTFVDGSATSSALSSTAAAVVLLSPSSLHGERDDDAGPPAWCVLLLTERTSASSLSLTAGVAPSSTGGEAGASMAELVVPTKFLGKRGVSERNDVAELVTHGQ